MPSSRTLDDDEMVAILEEIARFSKSATARIAAIKVLKQMDDMGLSAGDFDELDDEVSRRRASRKAS